MHERAGDKLLDSIEHDERKVPLSVVPQEQKPPPVIDEIKFSVEPKKVVINEAALPPAKWFMTRRFTITEKLKIIEKYKESQNMSATCR